MKNLQLVNKKVNLNLVGIDGNAFSIMGAFKNQAKTERWSAEEINTVISEAMNSDYYHLIAVINSHCDSN